MPKVYCPKCEHHHLKAVDCRDDLLMGLTRIRISLGADFETHGGRKVMFKGWISMGGHESPPAGTVGTVESTFKSKRSDGLPESVSVEWDYREPYWREDDPRRTCLGLHRWEDLVVLEADENGGINPGSFRKARLKTTLGLRSLLLPCPFCGSRKFYTYTEHGAHHLVCNECSGGGPPISEDFPIENVLLPWNIRSGPKDALSEARRQLASRPDWRVWDGKYRVMDGVKPCPFCGGISLAVCPNDSIALVRCVWCGAYGPLGRFDTRQDETEKGALDRWEKRFQGETHET